jgi:hypothetical protein
MKQSKATKQKQKQKQKLQDTKINKARVNAYHDAMMELAMLRETLQTKIIDRQFYSNIEYSDEATPICPIGIELLLNICDEITEIREKISAKVMVQYE